MGRFQIRLSHLCFAVCLIGLLAASGAVPATAATLNVPPEAIQAMDKLYAGNPQAAIAILRILQQNEPENPLGFLLEGEAAWWLIYCDNAEVKYGLVDAWKRGKKPEDEAYFALADKVIVLSEAQLAKSDTAEMRFYAGSGYALKARLFGLRGENRAVAHAGVSARAEFLRALALDPQMADAEASLGLYNYYVDALPGIVKMLRFFMGIPGGDRNEGIRQMQVGIDHGILTPVEMRFYLAKNLRNFDQQYARAIEVADPLAARYPNNPVFQLLLGNLNSELNRTEEASEHFRAALRAAQAQGDCPACVTCMTRVREIANSFLATQN